MGILDGKVAIVTGASRGIGAEIPRRFARTGSAVLVAGRCRRAQPASPGMREKGRGWILNLPSGAARPPLPPPSESSRLGGTVYGMCKAALERFSTGLAAELYDDDIAVNA